MNFKGGPDDLFSNILILEHMSHPRNPLIPKMCDSDFYGIGSVGKIGLTCNNLATYRWVRNEIKKRLPVFLAAL
jgi:hypothetical protein